MTTKRLTRPGILIVEAEKRRRLLFVSSTAEGIVLRRSGDASPVQVSYDELVLCATGRTAKEWLR